MILVTGGAGYIGSHVVEKLLEDNYQVLVLDNFTTGFIEPLQILQRKFNDLSYVKCDLGDLEQLKDIFSRYEISAVIHLAAKIDVAESVQKPALYNQENYLNSVNLVEAMTAAGVNNLIFSSTAAVYGNPIYTPIDELHPTNAINPYATTKLDFEKYLHQCKNLKYVIFRFFNVGGASSSGLIGKSHLQSQDVLENLMKTVLGQKAKFGIFGTDFSTPDGTAIRDLVHVEDIASAIVLSLKKIDQVNKEVFNLGSEEGFSIKEIISQSEEILQQKIPVENSPRRLGDLSVSVASAHKAKTILGWQPTKSNLKTIIGSDWQWRQKHPQGYNI